MDEKLNEQAEQAPNPFIESLIDYLVGNFDLMAGPARFMAYCLIALTIICLSWLANQLARKFLLNLVARVVKRSKNRFDDIFLEKRVFERLSHLAPAVVISLIVPLAFPHLPSIQRMVDVCISVYLYIVAGLFLSAFANAMGSVFEKLDPEGKRPTKGYIQAFKLVVFLVLGVLIASTVMGKSPKILFSGLGALTAILLLIFKDTILGLVAGIQLSFNNMVRKGDWITVPSAGADGDVMEVTLTTINVQNWDKTISHIPIYSLVSSSFTNWRGMYDSGGRRIKRALNIDMTSVRFLDQEMMNRLAEIRLLQEYLNQKNDELEQHRKDRGLTGEDPRNARHLTNLGTFRAYVKQYLKHHPMIHQEMTFLVRYLQTTSEGLPMEIYVFSRDQVWANYEAIQADIIDHLLAIMPEFGLRIFQNPVGHDFTRLVNEKS